MIAPKSTFCCQQCGGRAASVQGREYLQCEYCRSLVFTADNPLTVDRVTPCGGDLEAECPVCQKTLCTGQIEERPVLYCDGCYGLLLKNEDFGAITRVRRTRRAGHEAEPCRPLNPDEYERNICCPNCRTRMEVHPYYGPGNIVMDSCPGCQYVWLDHGELRIVEQAEGGRQPEAMPLFMNDDGEVTIIPAPMPHLSSGHDQQDSPLRTIADLLFGL
ncbi:MAG: zf-TFIIB domain-containing protein [Fuerstiella sp.]|nr:zf-TFIIB domain-containing protein [Fuerstiella sp.]